MKIDVEGFEGGVIQALEPLLRAGKVKIMLLDYHAQILQANGISPAEIEARILEAGMVLDGCFASYDGYRLYRCRTETLT